MSRNRSGTFFRDVLVSTGPPAPLYLWMPATLGDRHPQAPIEGYAAARKALAAGILPGSPEWPQNPHLAAALAEPNVRERMTLLEAAAAWNAGMNAAREQYEGDLVTVNKDGRQCLRRAGKQARHSAPERKYRRSPTRMDVPVAALGDRSEA